MMRIANYFTNVAYLLAAAFLVVVSQAFGSSVAGWIGFGVSAGIVLVALAQVILYRKLIPKLGHAAVLLMGVWSVVAALAFTGSTLTWLVFADAIGVAGLALANLGIHEFSTERVVHQLEVVTRDGSVAREQQYTAA
jgi:hypothetical protein